MEEKLGTVIERNRLKKKMSQRELAILVKVSNSTIARIEKGLFESPSPEVLRGIAEALDIDYFYLLSLNKQIDDDPEIRIIQRAARKMSPEDRTKMMTLLRSSFVDAFKSVDNDEGEN